MKGREINNMVASTPKPKLWTRAEYQRLGELGAFAPDERVELLEGVIVSMSPQNLAHTRCISHATTVLVRLFAHSHYVRVQCSLFLTDLSEPEPDFALVKHELVDGPDVTDNPKWADLVIEVSDSSLAYDQGSKLALYAQAGLPEYWIVNLPARQLEVYREPNQGKYAQMVVLKAGDSVTANFAPEVPVPVASLF